MTTPDAAAAPAYPHGRSTSVLTPEQVADFLHVSVSTVYRELRAGRLPGMKVGQSWRTSRAALERLLEGAA